MHVPPGFSRLAPYVFADGAGAYMDHLLAALDGVDEGRTVSPDGVLRNGQLRFGDNSMMVSEASERYPASRSTFYLYVADCDAAVRRALDHGMELDMAAADMPYGDRQAGVRDRAGNIWWLSQRLTAEPYHP